MGEKLFKKFLTLLKSKKKAVILNINKLKMTCFSLFMVNFLPGKMVPKILQTLSKNWATRPKISKTDDLSYVSNFSSTFAVFKSRILLA